MDISSEQAQAPPAAQLSDCNREFMPRGEFQRVQRSFEMLLRSDGAKADPARSASAKKSVEGLYAQLKSGQVPPATWRALLQVVGAIEHGDLASAGHARSELVSSDWAVCRCWLPGVRWLLAAAACPSAAAGGSPQSLVGAPVAGPPPRTAPEATGPNVIEGLPESWPQRAPQRKQAEERVVVAEADVALVRSAFASLMGLHSNGADHGRRGEAARQLELLCVELEQGRVKRTVSQAVLRLAHAVETRDLAAAKRLHAELATGEWQGCKGWLPALKWLLQGQAQQTIL